MTTHQLLRPNTRVSAASARSRGARATNQLGRSLPCLDYQPTGDRLLQTSVRHGESHAGDAPSRHQANQADRRRAEGVVRGAVHKKGPSKTASISMTRPAKDAGRRNKEPTNLNPSEAMVHRGLRYPSRARDTNRLRTRDCWKYLPSLNAVEIQSAGCPKPLARSRGGSGARRSNGKRNALAPSLFSAAHISPLPGLENPPSKSKPRS